MRQEMNDKDKLFEFIKEYAEGVFIVNSEIGTEVIIDYPFPNDKLAKDALKRYGLDYSEAKYPLEIDGNGLVVRSDGDGTID